MLNLLEKRETLTLLALSHVLATNRSRTRHRPESNVSCAVIQAIGRRHVQELLTWPHAAEGARAPGIGDPWTVMNASANVETGTTTIRPTAMMTTVGAAARAGAIRTGGAETPGDAMTGTIPVGALTDTMTGMTPADVLGDVAIEMTLATGQVATIQDDGTTEANQQIVGIVAGDVLRLVPTPLGNLD